MMHPHNAFGWGWNGTLTFVLILMVLALVTWLVAGLARPVPPPPDRTRLADDRAATERAAPDRAATERAAPDRAATERAVWDRAEEIVAERYARGEIDDDEYVRRLGALRTGRGSPLAGAR